MENNKIESIFNLKLLIKKKIKGIIKLKLMHVIG